MQEMRALQQPAAAARLIPFGQPRERMVRHSYHELRVDIPDDLKCRDHLSLPDDQRFLIGLGAAHPGGVQPCNRDR